MVQIAHSGAGSPWMAWGDTFFYVPEKIGGPRKMPLATMITKDYVGFDSFSRLNWGGAVSPEY